MNGKIKILIFISVLVLVKLIAIYQPVASYAHLYYDFGLKALANNDPKQAAKDFQRAVFHNPKFSEPYYQLGLIAKINGDEQTKMEWFQKAVEHGNREIEALAAVGDYYFNQGLFEKAIPCFSKFNDFNSNWNLGRIYDQIDNLPKAYVYFKKAVAWNGSNMEAKYKLALIAHRLNKHAEVLEIIHTMRKMGYPKRADDLMEELKIIGPGAK